MPRTIKNKKTKPASRPIKRPITAEPPKQPVYININEHQTELAAKNRTLWLVVGIFAIILVCGWLIILRANLQNTANQAGFSQISQEITNSLARFDTEIKNRIQPQPLSIDDLSALKENLEQRLKSNPDSSIWPTHELDKLALAMQYPDNWQKVTETKTAAVLADFSATSTLDQYGRIAITLKSNPKKYDLATWQTKNKIALNGYIAEKPLFVFSSTTPESLIFSKNASATTSLDRLVYINFPAQKIILEIAATAKGDTFYYQPLIDEIIRTIKIIK